MEIDARGSEKSLSFCCLKIDNKFCVSRLTREGAGTTILAAAQQGYQAVGIEVTDAYFQLGTERVREALKEEVDVQ